MQSESPHLYKFGAFCIEVDTRLLLQNGEPVSLTPKAFDTLLALVRRNGKVVRKDELLKEVWPDTFVEEATLAQNIFTLRKALGQNGSGTQYIETIPRHGYRFVADVEEIRGTPSEVVLETVTRTRIVSEEIERSNPPDRDAEGAIDHFASAHSRADEAEALSGVAIEPRKLGEGNARKSLKRVQPWIAFALVPGLAIGLISYLRLRKNKQPPVAAAFGNPKVRFSKLTNTGRAKRAAISPDGKYLAYVQIEGAKEGLWIRQISSSRSIPVVEPGPVRYQGLSFASDSSSIFYVVYDQDDYGSLYQIPVLGGASRKVTSDVDSRISFSPDGKRFAFVRNESNRKESSILIAETESGREKRLATSPGFPSFSNEGPAWSPDGSVIVCPVRVGDASKTKMELMSVNSETGEQRPIRTHQWDSIGQTAWLSDGHGLVLTAWDSTASLLLDQLWEISYPDGEAHMLSNDLNSYTGVSLTSGASTLVTIQADRVANFSVFSKGDFEKPVQITSGAGDKPSELMGISWTADNRIIYGSSASGNVDVWVMNADGTNQKQLTADPYINFRPSTSADGQVVVFVSRREGTPHLWKMDINGRNLVQLTRGGGETLPTVSPDGLSVVYATADAGGPRLWKMKLDGSDPVQLIQQKASRPVYSPDGKMLLCIYMQTDTGPWEIAVIPAEGGAPLRTFKITPAMYYEAGLRWGPGGQSYTYVDNRDGVSNIWMQPLNGESPKKLTSFTSGQIFRFDWSRDGQMLAVDHGIVINDVVLISNFA
jgi:eukaryotic-like serine/threonine-protein kinase